MKISYFNFLGIFVALLLFASCEKEQMVVEEFAPLSEEQMAMNHLKQTPHLVLFAALEIDHEMLEVNGFIIDKFAKLRTIKGYKNFDHDFDGTHITDTYMRQLYENSDKKIDLDVVELVKNLKQAYTLNKDITADYQVDNEIASTSKVYMGFKRDGIYETTIDCGGDDLMTVDNEQLHFQILLNANGKLVGKNDSERAVKIYNWLSSLDDQVDG